MSEKDKMLAGELYRSTDPELQAAMHAKGLTSPYVSKSGAPVSVSKLGEMLANPFYIGIVAWNGVRYPGQHNKKSFDLLSRGPDGQEGGGDDIENWTQQH